MQFQIPQFIEVEDKIFGPFTFKQFIYMTGAAGLAFIAYRVLPLYVAVVVIVGFGSLGAALALFEWNGRPFILALEYGFYYFIHTKLYIWSHKRKEKKAKEAMKERKLVSEVYVPRLSESKLHDLAWSLDIKEKIGKIGLRKSEAPGFTPSNAPSSSNAVGDNSIRTAKEALVK